MSSSLIWVAKERDGDLMIENISYKRCVCDICEKEEHIAQSARLPITWDEIVIGRKTYDVCVDCLAKIDITVEDLKEKYL